jgi:CheY-like chemotaxis protein
MTQPLALVVYERLLPGTQIINRLQDLNYRVQVVADADTLVDCAQQSMPMLVLADLESSRQNVCAALALLKQNPATRHLPVIAFGADNAPDRQEAARVAGATLVVGETAILNHLAQFLDQALQVD